MSTYMLPILATPSACLEVLCTGARGSRLLRALCGHGRPQHLRQLPQHALNCSAPTKGVRDTHIHTPTCRAILARDSLMRMMASSWRTVTGTGGVSLSSRSQALRACAQRVRRQRLPGVALQRHAHVWLPC